MELGALYLSLFDLGAWLHWYLEEPGELAITIVDILVAALVAQSVDTVAQGQQGAVDVGSFLHTLPTVLCLGVEQRAELWHSGVGVGLHFSHPPTTW